MTRDSPFELRARELAIAAGLDPDSRVPRPGESSDGRGWPAWCGFREAARAEQRQREAASVVRADPGTKHDVPFTVFGEHDPATLEQMRNCMRTGRAVAGVICADGHLGYAQPVGGVIAYEGQVSISGVGFDIGCGNLAVRLDVPYAAIRDQARTILADIRRHVSFGVGQANAERVQHPVLDDDDAWRASGMEDYRRKARMQLGTVGGGNHYVDLFRDEEERVWIGVHFGSRGLGHTTATRYLKRAGGKEGMNVPPAVVTEDGELGQAYLAAMELAGRYAEAGRECVVERVRQIIGGTVMHTVHNHHNYAWQETHGGQTLRVVRKGATPAFPGQQGFVGGSMCDDAVILEGMASSEAESALYSTVHGAGRLFSRTEARRRATWVELESWLQGRGVLLAGGDLDESPMAYRRLPDVLAHHAATVRVLHRLRPFAVAMAGPSELDPFKD